MRNYSSSESAFSSPRLLAALILCLSSALLAVLTFATPPSPAAGTLNTTNHRTIVYQEDGVGLLPNPTAVGLGAPDCTAPNSCSTFLLTIDSSVHTAAAGYDPTKYQIAIQWQWGVSVVDYDWFVEDAMGTVVSKNQSTADPSSVVLSTALPPGIYKVIGTLSTGAPVPYTGTVTLEAKPQISGICPPSDPSCKPPRYQSYPAGPGQADNAGEPSLGVDWNPNVASLQHDKFNTGGVAFFTSGNNEFRVNFDDCSSPAIYKWVDVSFLTDQQFALSDPIGYVDHYSSQELGLSYPPPHTPGRVFAIDLLGGEGNSIGAYSDDDGKTSLPGGTGGPGAGPDHETLGGGPYASPIPSTKVPGSYPNAVYYCSQNIAAEAQCSRSDDGGQTFGPSVPIFTPTQCTGGIHGHVKVAPDGTVYVPNSSCGTTGTAGVAVSTDNGLTWTENNVSGSTSSLDPSVGIGQNNLGKPTKNNAGTNTIYVGYIDGNGHPYVAHSGDRGANYSTPVDVGAPFNIQHAVFPEVVTGDDNRAAFAFVGTGPGVATDGGTCDPIGAVLNCANIWHMYVATTYDGGSTWITTDVTPNDPVQQGTVCLQGTTCAAGRNLLDFNDFAIDSEGRGLIGYADGCVNCDNTFQGQSGASHGTVTRQSGGRRLFSHFDPIEPAVPAAPQMVSAVLQSTGGAIVTWLEPDNGGSPITGYRVFRGTSSGTETFLANVSGATTTKYFDSLTPAFPAGTNVFYYVTAINAQGQSDHCREVSLIPPSVGGGNTCTYPYVEVDPAGSAGTTPTDPTMGELTIQYVNIGEPFTACADNSITFLMKVATLDPSGTGMAAPPPNAEYQILFKINDNNGNPQTVFVDMDTNGTTPTPEYSYGRRDVSATGGSFDTTVCTNDGLTQTCPQISGTVNPNGTITIKLDVSAPLVFPVPSAGATGTPFTVDASKVGTKLSNVTGSTILLVGAAGSGFLETIQTTGGGSYTRKGNVSCDSVPPIAALSATPASGKAPLAVTFDGKASHEPASACGTISLYTIGFGDGSGQQSNKTGTFQHTYTAAGDYPARLTVTDTNGLVSTNPAQVVVTVDSNSTPTPTPTATPTPTPTATPTPTPSVSPATVQFSSTKYQMQENQGKIVLTVQRTGDDTRTATVHFATSPGSAKPGADYTEKSGDVTFPANGANTRTITIPITNDHTPEGTETFQVTLTPGQNAQVGPRGSATVTIIDKDGNPPSVQFSSATYQVQESGKNVVLTVERDGDRFKAVTVHFATSDGTAHAGSDYVATSGDVTFPGGGAATETITIPIKDDNVPESAETFKVTLTPTASATLGPRKVATVTITDKD